MSGGSRRAAAKPRLRLRLYVAGRAPNSDLARANLSTLLNEAGRSAHVEIVDVLDEPERAVRDGVIVTPALVVGGTPPVRIIGNLSNREDVRAALGLSE